ncbi:O-fucosyltransferase family protein [Actinidia rufa]|uniref:O-fucosyltransferase family protein n=1 Tax=Actinidia rufa TaxID=165716 RepID=A0A7J0DIQ6_9ERIC|nr:O-fucosyltransferase family protein [Actinidia rufa]
MGAAAFHRRRHHNNHGRLIPAISAVSGALLLVFVLFSFLTPSPTDDEHFRHDLRLPVVNNGVVNVEVSGLRVPTSGGRLDRDLWKSRMSKFYYGCSNASKKFQEAEAITQSKRYLLIATSGGLNQQRTGRRTPYGFGYFLK